MTYRFVQRVVARYPVFTRLYVPLIVTLSLAIEVTNRGGCRCH